MTDRLWAAFYFWGFLAFALAWAGFLIALAR